MDEAAEQYGRLFCLGGLSEDHEILEEKEIPKNPLGFSVLLMMAIATSIDALAAGITIAAVGTPILMPSIIIGVVAFVFSFAGLYIGAKSGDILEDRAEIIGGLMLIAIGTKTLIEHLI